VDDLLAIAIIAVFYADTLAVLPLVLAVVPLGLFTVLVQRRVRSPWLLLPLAVATWVLIHESRDPRHRGRRAARVRRAGRASFERPGAGARGAFRASVAADLVRGGGPGVRVLPRG
jgi:Na+/H+ antiporter 1